jgi:hypothetical protein
MFRKMASFDNNSTENSVSLSEELLNFISNLAFNLPSFIRGS